MTNKFYKLTTAFFSENLGFMLFIIFIFASKSSLADWNTVPTASMKPTIIEGDRVWIDKLAYDLQLPFTNISLSRFADPERNDIVIFESKVSDKRLVKRVIGIPGDSVSLSNNRLSINGISASYSKPLNISDKELTPSFQSLKYVDITEKLLELNHPVRLLEMKGGVPSSFDTITVPQEFYLVMGDNRELSADSRIIGLIPRDEIIGKTNTIVMSLNYDDFFLPRKNRFFKTI